MAEWKELQFKDEKYTDANAVTAIKNEEVSAIKVWLGTQQTITDNTYTTVNLDQEVKDAKNEFNTTTHKFVASEAGTYFVVFVLTFLALADGDIITGQIRNNDTSVTERQIGVGTAGNNLIWGGDIISLAVNDEVTLVARHKHGSNINLYNASKNTNMVMHKLYG